MSATPFISLYLADSKLTFFLFGWNTDVLSRPNSGRVCWNPSLSWCESWHLHGFCFLLGDGGNDVSMIQEADCGVGVEGRVRLCPFDRHSHNPFPVKISLMCRDMNTDDSSLWAAIVLCRGSKDDRMLLGSSQCWSLSTAHICVKSLSRWGLTRALHSWDITRNNHPFPVHGGRPHLW